MPALAVASVASAVTPMVTSCKNNPEPEVVTSWEHQFIGDKKFTAYESKVTPAEKKSYANEYAIDDAYVEAVKKNPQILADDYLLLLLLSPLIKEYRSTIIQLFKDVTIKVSNISVKSVISQDFTEKQPYKHFYSYDVELITTSSKSSTEWQTTNLTIHYKDLPFHFLLNTGKGWVSQLGGQGGITTIQFLTVYWPTLITKNIELGRLFSKISPAIGADIKDFDKDGNVLNDYSVEAKACDVNPDIKTSPYFEIYQTELNECQVGLSIISKCFPSIELESIFVSQLQIFSTYLKNAALAK